MWKEKEIAGCKYTYKDLNIARDKSLATAWKKRKTFLVVVVIPTYLTLLLKL